MKSPYTHSKHLQSSAPPSGLWKFWGKRPLSTDYVLDEYKKHDTCMARRIHHTQDESDREAWEKPASTRTLEIPCPASLSSDGTCRLEDCCWECDDCKATLEYDRNTLLYWCDCGSGAPSSFAFRCLREEHTDFTQFSPDALKTVLKQLTTFGEKTVLILGESGEWARYRQWGVLFRKDFYMDFL